MALFHDVTDEYVARSRKGAEESSALRMSREELKRLHDSGLAIADTETTGLKAGESGLTEPAVIRAMTIGEIKAYNKEAHRQGLPVDQRISAPRGSANSEIRLIAFQHFVLPNKPMIHDREDGHKLPSGSYTSDRQKAFEYDISAFALDVTGAELVREKGYGPLVDLKIHGKKVKTLPSFVPLMQSFLLFTGESAVGPKHGVAYFNAPFDIPFLRELFVDAMAYEVAKKNEHREHNRAVNVRLPTALNIEYGDAQTTPEQRTKIVAHIKKRLIDSGIAQAKMAEYFAPARWHCILQAYRSAHPELAGHTLDGLMNTAGLAQGSRGAHSAIEDVVLTARGMLHLLKDNALSVAALPTMGELTGLILQRSQGKAVTSTAADNGRDVVIDFAHGDTAHAKAIEHWIRSFNRAKPADITQPVLNPHGRQWFTRFTEDALGAHIIVSGAHKRPLFLSFMKHLGVASHILDGRYPWITALEANDLPGTFVDVTVDGECLHDVPWNILRRNVAYIHQQSKGERAELLTFLRDIEKASDALGGVLLREENGMRYLRLYGHVRQHGTVDIPWPKKVPLVDARKIVFERLEEATRLGLSPHAARSDISNQSKNAEDDQDQEVENDKHTSQEQRFSSTTMDIISPPKGENIYRQITPELFQLFKAALPPDDRHKNFNRNIDTVKFGKHYTIRVNSVSKGEKRFVTLEGPPEAFDAYMARRKKDGTYEAMAEKPNNILIDAGWLLDRLQKIPGVPKDGVEVTANNRIIVHQPLGIGTDSLALMHTIGIPHRVEEKELRFSAGALMQDAFTWSLAISRALETASYENKMKASSIVPSITKGLKDTSDRGESHKRLDHAKFDPLIGLQLHYKARGGEVAEIIRIPPDKMVERSLPIGRRRVQRVFARLAHLPRKIESADKEVRWEVSFAPLEHTLFVNALHEKSANVDWRKDTEGNPCFVIAENTLSTSKNPVYLALKHVSDKLARLTESTDIPEWYFSTPPDLNGDRIRLQLPERSTMFSASAVPVYQDIQSYLQRMQTGGMDKDSLGKNIARIMGNRSGKDGSALKQLDYALRRDSNANIATLMNVVDQESPNLLRLYNHERELAGCITPSDASKGEDKRELALNQKLMSDRRVVAQIIAACHAMADKEPDRAAEWTDMRHKATFVADRMARTINGVDRLREALNTSAYSIANEGSHWRSSLIGANVHARLDMLEMQYLKAAQAGTASALNTYVDKQFATLKQFGRQPEDEDVFLKPYCENAALRLAVLHAVETDSVKAQQLNLAAATAMLDAYDLTKEQAQDFLKLYCTIANPAIDGKQCRAAGEQFLHSIQSTHPKFSADCYWMPMQLFGKATPADITASQKEELAPAIAKHVKKAYHEVGLAHLYLAAEKSAELTKLRDEIASKKVKQTGKLCIRERLLESSVEHLTSLMLYCYAASGYSTENATTELRAQTRAALEDRDFFSKKLKKHKELLALGEKRSALVEYTDAQQVDILRAAILQEGGQRRLEELVCQQHLKETSFAKQLQAVCINNPDFEAHRAHVNKTAILAAKNRMLTELDDLNKIEYHVRRDLEALALLFQDVAMQLHPHLEATQIKPQQMDLPEFQGLTKNPIPALRDVAKTLDELALRQAKAKFSPDVTVTKDEYKHRRITHSLSTFLGKSTHQIADVLPPTKSPVTHNAARGTQHCFILDTSAIIGYFDTLRHHTARPDTAHEKKPDFARYHNNLLQRLEALAMPEAHGYMPLRVPDYVFYELSGLMPLMLQKARNHFAEIEGNYKPKLEKTHGTRHTNLLREKAREYQMEIDNLVDWSIRLDRRRPLDNKSSIGDRVEELNQLFTLFAYHPDIIVSTHVGADFYQSARIESAVVAGVGKIHKPVAPGYYRDELAKLTQAIQTNASDADAKPPLAKYTLSFKDVLQTPGLHFDIDHLRIHWGQMYFMGLIDEDQYRDFMRNMSGAGAANDQGYDSNKRFVTYGSLVNRTKETGLTGSGLVREVKKAHGLMIKEGVKPDTVNRRNLTFEELQRFLPEQELDVRNAIGPAKLTMDQCVFGGLLPGAAIKRHREGDEYSVRGNDAEVEVLRLIARTLGYKTPEITTDKKDRYEALRNSLKHQGFFERQVTLEDCVKLQQVLTQAGEPCEKLDRLLEYIPTVLCEKPKGLVQKKRDDGRVDLSAPLERMFTQALVHGILSPTQFLALLIKLDPTALNVDHAPMCSVKSGDVTVQFKLRKPLANIHNVSADKLAAAVNPDSIWLNIPNNDAPHFNRRQHFCDLVAVGRSARRNGASFSEGQLILDCLLADQFRTSELAPQQGLRDAYATFKELFGAEEGDAIFFQLLKDFESRQERQFQSGDTLPSAKKPAECAIAANHRNRLIDRRNKGEVSVVQLAHAMQRDKPDAILWVIGNDSDVVSAEQRDLLDPETHTPKNGQGKHQDPVTLGKRGETPGVRLRPPVAAQHSRLVGAQETVMEGDENVHTVPTRDWLEYVGRLNGVSPTAHMKPDDFTHKYAKASAPFRTKFLEM